MIRNRTVIEECDGGYVYTPEGLEPVTFSVVKESDLPRPHPRGYAPPDAKLAMSERLLACYGPANAAHFGACTMAALTAPDKVRHALEEFVANFRTGLPRGHGLLLYGETGVGKTYAAAAVANELMGYGHRVRMARLEALMRMDAAEMRREMARLTDRETELVLIDDFGSERASAFGVASTHQIIDDLYCSGVVLLVTTNLTKSQIAKPASIEARRPLDRLKERCKCVEYVGPNQRMARLA